MGKDENRIIEEAFVDALDDNILHGEAGQSATPSQAARGEAADGQPLRTAGGVAPELEEAADMSTSDGLGPDPELLNITRAELAAAVAAGRTMLDMAPRDGSESERTLQSFCDKVEAHFKAKEDQTR